MQNNLHQNNLNNRVFNPNDHTTWRWNDPVLAHTPISEAEARQISQIARHLGGEFSFLSRTSNADILTAVTNHNLPEAQQLIARRAAIIITAQMKNGIPVRDASKVDIHHQINTFFEGLPEDLKVDEAQKILIHKTIDSYFTAKEFRVGRRKLDSYSPFPKNTQNRPEMTKAHLLQFFNHMIADIPANIAQDSYIRLKNDNPVKLNDQIYVFLSCAFGYLKNVYEGIQDSPNRNVLNHLITAPTIVNALKLAMIKGIPAKALGHSLGHIGNDPHTVAQYLIFISEVLKHTSVEDRALILISAEYIKILFEASQSGIEALHLASSLHINENHRSSFMVIHTIEEKMAYISLAVGLVQAPDSPAIHSDFMNALLSNRKGAQALNYARYVELHVGLSKHCLAKCLSTVLSSDNPPSDIEQIADYIYLVGKALHIHVTTLYSMWKSMVSTMFSSYYQNAHPGEQADLILKDESMSLAFYRAQLLGLDAYTISYILHEHLDVQETCLLFNFLLGILEANIKNMDVAFIKIFFEKVNYAAYTLNEARKKGLSPISTGQLIRIAEKASVGMMNLSLAISVLSNYRASYEEVQATPIGLGGMENLNLALNLISNHGLSSDELNTYLSLDQALKNFNNHRYHNKGSDLLVAIIRHTLKDQEIAQLRRQVEELKELPKAQD